LTTTSATSRQKTAPRGLSAFSPEAIFVISGISQNAGSVLAKSIFGEVRPATVAWIRISFATFVLLGLSWRHWSPWSRRDGVRTARPWTPSEARATALLLLWRRTAFAGAAIIMVVMLGAMGTHVYWGRPSQVTSEILPLLLSTMVALGRRKSFLWQWPRRVPA